MPLAIALYGDSNVSRLKNFCGAELRVPANVCWFEKSGVRSDFLDKKGKFDVAAKANYDRMKTLRPDVTFLNVGENDLTTTSKPREVYGRIMCLVDVLKQAAKQVSRGKRGRSFSEGWVEFKNKKIAKSVAASLNNTQIGGKKKCKWREELWNLKYLHRFKWAHLNERLAYEKAVHAQRMRTEISQAKREANFYIQNAEKDSIRQKKLKKKLKQSGEVTDEQSEEGINQGREDSDKVYQVRLKDTEVEIVGKRKHMSGNQTGGSKTKQVKTGERTLGKSDEKGGKSFLTKIFSGGLDADY